MFRKKLSALTWFGVQLLLLSSLVNAYPDQVPPAHTGGFGEETCASCHFSEVRDARPVLRFDGLPGLLEGSATFVPGATYQLSLSPANVDRGVNRAGFQLSARITDESCEGCQAGELSAGASVRHQTAGEVVYLSQHNSASWLRDEPVWSFQWQAPQQAVPVVFHISVNVADGDESPLGDQVYQAELIVQPQTE